MNATARAILDGDRRALARAITRIEAGEDMRRVLTALSEAVSPTPRLGVTGPPGAGKSTLLDGIISEIRSRGRTVAVLAVDPSSPLTGGALLGDRIRMQDHADDAGVYVRSMASRGHLGGLAAAARDALTVLSHAGFDYVLIETVGVGQSEVEVMHHADLTVLVVAPGWGDQIQADKAGVVEIADVIVVNKGDRPGADEVQRALQQALGDGGREILVTSAVTGEGVSSFVDLIETRLGPG